MNLFSQMLSEIKQSGLPTILYGSGPMAKLVNEYFERNGIEPDGYAVDKEYLKGRTEHDGKPLYILDEYIAKNPCNIVMSIALLPGDWVDKLRNKASETTHVYILDFQSYLTLPGDHTKFEEFYRQNKSTFDAFRNDLEDEKSKESMDIFINQKLSGVYQKEFSPKPAFFDDEIIKFTENEIFVDCGAYDGDTVISFLDNLTTSYKKIYALEPDPKTAAKMKENLKDCQNVELIIKGVYDHTCTLCFSADGNTGSRVEDNGDIKIEVTSIDDLVGNEDVTFIKMDVEGSELAALRGAEKTIRRCKPKLAVCVYHRIEDMTTIPQYIKSLNPDYKFYFRNYYPMALEAVLYAI